MAKRVVRLGKQIGARGEDWPDKNKSAGERRARQISATPLFIYLKKHLLGKGKKSRRQGRQSCMNATGPQKKGQILSPDNLGEEKCIGKPKRLHSPRR